MIQFPKMSFTWRLSLHLSLRKIRKALVNTDDLFSNFKTCIRQTTAFIKVMPFFNLLSISVEGRGTALTMLILVWQTFLNSQSSRRLRLAIISSVTNRPNRCRSLWSQIFSLSITCRRNHGLHRVKLKHFK